MKRKALAFAAALILVLVQVPLFLSISGEPADASALMVDDFESYTGDQDVQSYLTKGYTSPSSVTLGLSLSTDQGVNGSKALCITHSSIASWGSMLLNKSGVPVSEDGLQFYFKTEKETKLSLKVVADGVVKGYFKLNGADMNSVTLASGVYTPSVKWQDVGITGGTVIIQIHLIAPTTSSLQANNIYLDNILYTQTPVTVQDAADGITGVTPPLAGETSLKFPEVPEGYQINIKSSSRTDVIGLDGGITPPDQPVSVEVVFTVTNGTESADTQPFSVTVPAAQADPNLVIQDFEAMTGDQDVEGYLTKGYTNPSSITLGLSLSQDQGADGSKALCVMHSAIGSWGAMQLNRANIPVSEDGMQFYFKTEKETRISMKVIADGVVKGYFKLNETDINSMVLSPGVYYPSVNWQDIGVMGGSITIQYHLIAPTTASLQANTFYVDNMMYTQLPAEITPQEVADGITEIEAIKQGDATIKYPTVPQGFQISIKSSSLTDVIGLDGNITQPDTHRAVVDLVFTVTKGTVSADTQTISVVVPSLAEALIYQNFESMTGDNDVAGFMTKGYSSDGTSFGLALSQDQGVNGSKAVCITHSAIPTWGAMQLSHSNIPVKEDGLKFYLKTDKETRVSIKIIADGVVKGYFKINGNEINSMTLAPGVYHPQVNWQDINTLSGNVAIQYHIIAPTTAPLAENTVYIDELMYTQLNETRTAADIAQTITSIQQPIKDETVLTLPSVPTGFGIKILSTDSPSVITTAGKIYPQAQEKTVVLVLQVNRRLVVANTQPITVIVPARSRDNLLDSGAETFETANNESLMRFWNTASISSSSGTLSLSLSENGGSSDSKSMLIDTVLYYNYSIANFSKMIEKQKDGLTMRVDLRSLKMGDTTFTIAIYQGETVKGYLINDKLEPGIYYPVLWWDDIELTDPLTGGDISLRISMKCDKAHAQDGMAYAEKIALYLDDIMFATKSSTTPAQIAAGITGIEAPEKDEKNLHWPQVPNGYWISIKSTSNPSIIAKTGKLYPVKADVRVTLVFTVTAPGGESADTVPISVIVPGRTFYAPDVSGIGQYTVEDFERYTNTDDLKQVFSIIDPAENKVIDLEVSSPVSGEKSLRIDFISQTTPISLFSGRVNPLKGDGLVLQVRSLEKLTLQIILSDGSNWVTYQLPIDASEESRILNIDWDKFNTNRGTFYEMNNGNLTLTVKAISNRATDDLQSLYIDNIGYYNYGEIYANYKLLHPDPVDDPSGNDTDPGTDTPDTGIQINLITILVLILSSCLTFGSLYMINYIKKDGYRHEK